jgi:hypothetical protein
MGKILREMGIFPNGAPNSGRQAAGGRRLRRTSPPGSGPGSTCAAVRALFGSAKLLSMDQLPLAKLMTSCVRPQPLIW